MGQLLHGSAKTTPAIRAAIQRSKASVAELSERCNLNSKTVMKWKKRNFLHDAPMGPKAPCSPVLSREEEALAVGFRRHTLLPLDDCLYALQATIPHLTRSSLHRLFQRHGISRLPGLEGDKPRKRFKAYAIGYFHADIAEVLTEEGRLFMLAAIDRVTRFAFAELHEKATRRVAAEFLHRLVAAVPYTIHTVLTDNGTHFTDPQHPGSAVPEIKAALANGELFRAHAFELACARNDIGHRLTKPNHPWTNGQVERMNRTIKQATVRRYYYDSHERLRTHLQTFLDAYNFAKRLKTLNGLTPFEYICKLWTEQPKRFNVNPIHHMAGPNI